MGVVEGVWLAMSPLIVETVGVMGEGLVSPLLLVTAELGLGKLLRMLVTVATVGVGGVGLVTSLLPRRGMVVIGVTGDELFSPPLVVVALCGT